MSLDHFIRLRPLNFFFAGLVILVLLGSSTTMAQRYMSHSNTRQEGAEGATISSPTAASLGEYVVNPVGYNTGVPNISVPLYTIKLKDFSFPISANYHGGGIKVEETASSIGLGWSLSSGGMITRSVKDKPDDAYSNCIVSRAIYEGANYPAMQGFDACGYGMLHALTVPSNTYFNGLGSYNINLESFVGTSAMNLIKKFYMVTQYADQNDLYIAPYIDQEPDIFYFNFAGRQGQFVFDLTGGTPQVRMFPHQDLAVEYFLDSSSKLLTGFRITDEKGVKYTFNEIEVGQFSHAVNGKPVDYGLAEASGLDHSVRTYSAAGYERAQYNTSWMLTKIETPLGEFLDFTYEKDVFSFDTRGPQQTGLFYIQPTSGSLTHNPNDLTDGYYNCFNQNGASMNSSRIAIIENDDMKIEFLEGAARQDLHSERHFFVTPSGNFWAEGAYPIEQVIVSNKINGVNRVRKFLFTYDYFLSDLSEPINYTVAGSFYDYYDILLTDASNPYKRLRLRSIQEYGSDDSSFNPPYEFEYKYYDFTGNNSHKLPHRLSYQQDIWGYYNGQASNRTLIPSLYVYPTHYPVKDSRQFRVFPKASYSGSQYHMPAANRLPNEATADIGTLTRIKFPTKGHTTYTFELHTFRDEGQDYSGGGLRIKNVEQYDGKSTANNIVTNYTYNDGSVSSGQIISIPAFAIRNTNIGMLANDNSELAYKSYTTRYSSPLSTLATTNGSFVGYRKVTESMSGNGKKVMTYSVPAAWQVKNDIPVASGGECNPVLDGHCDGLYSLTSTLPIFVSSVSSNLNAANYDFSQNPAVASSFPFPDNPNYDWQRGHLLSETFFDNSGNTLQETFYNYSNYYPNNQTGPLPVYGYKISSMYARLTNGTFPNAFVFRAARYKLLTAVTKVLTSKTDVFHDVSNFSSTVGMQTNFTYNNPLHNEPTQTTSTDSRGKTISTELKYAEDFTGNELGSDLLRTNHMHGLPIRITTFVNGSPTSKTEKQYITKSGKTVIGQSVEYPNGVTPSNKNAFDYDPSGNVNQSVRVLKENASGLPLITLQNSALIWGYKSTLPVCEISNAKASDVFYSGFEDLDGNSSPGDSKAGIKSRTGGFTKQINGLSNGVYQLTYWLKSGATWGLQIVPVSVSGNSYTISIPSAQVDEVRLFPTGANLKTYTYAPLVGVTSVSDENNVFTYYEYDSMGRLVIQRDTDKKILKLYEYHFKN